VAELLIPEGYRLVKTTERVGSDDGVLRKFAFWFPKLRALNYRARYVPYMPTYRTEVERVGLLRYEVIAYQNTLERTGQSE
jgi:hypothetical protein